MQLNNQVTLVGRVSSDPTQRELPSGDQIVTLRLVVDRPGRKSQSRRPVDVIDLVCWTKSSQRAAIRLKPKDLIEATGSLRRRFFATPQGRSSRYEVELTKIRRVSQMPPE
ncbi:MAG TPA: single-stranded DNA-binding protein [Marmoricola sp.]|nr:single-stranded DNA-binding protein [Marmoricola sp.]HNO40238.1 single-stranded DNA-binding protein [Marmoricola sp.]